MNEEDKIHINSFKFYDRDELEELTKEYYLENKQLKEQLQNISSEFLKYDWKTSNKEQIINQLESLYNSIFRE